MSRFFSVTEFRTSMAFVAFVVASSAAAVADDSLTQNQKSQIDALFKKWDQTDSPGAAIGVIRKGKLVYSKGYGMANLEHSVRIEPSTVFYMASVSKHFVTFCILLLEEQGKLSLDDEIQKHLPDFPKYDEPLTIRNFIHHTSGVRDFLQLWRLKGNSFLDHMDESEVYELIKRQKKLNFKPGERYLYSNSCYFMLAMIVKKASGMSIRDYAMKHMFGPLGMDSTQFHDDVNRVLKKRASSYLQTGNGFANQISRFDLVGSGGLYSTIEDMALWDKNFYANKLGKADQSLIQKMETDGRLNNGNSAGYAFGLKNGTFRGLKTVEHGGSLGGYKTHFLRIPEKELSLVVLANVDNVAPSTRIREMAGILLSETKDPVSNKQPANPPKKVAIPSMELPKFTGEFLRPDGSKITFAVKDKALHATQSWNNFKYETKPTGDNTFVPPNAQVKFHFQEWKDGKAQRLVVELGGGRKEVLRRKQEFKTSDLGEFVGIYFSDELDVHLELFKQEDKLLCRYQHRYLEPMPLEAVGKDEFRAALGMIKIDREDKKVKGFQIDTGRVKGMQFVRVK